MTRFRRRYPEPGALSRRALLPRVAVMALALTPGTALAHVYGGNGGPGAGFMHPLTGFDHLLAMYTVGLLSAAIGGRAIWTVPAAFVLAMIGGGLVGIEHLALPGVEHGVALSVVVLGSALVKARDVPTGWALAAAAVFGIFHGYAHGAEMPRVATPGLYIVGFVAATVGLHLMGAISGLLVQCRPHGNRQLRIGGAAIAAAGLYLLCRLP